MRILVCLKSVPREIVRVKVSDRADRVLYECLGQTVNESDEYALEQALILKRGLACEVMVATVGSLKSQDVVYLGLAKGADQGVRIDFDTNDPGVISTVMASAIRKLECDLILTGVESWDNLSAQVGTLTAEKLGIPSVYAVIKVEAAAGSETLRVTREVGGGVHQVLEVSLPALLCVQSSSLPLSYAPPARIIQARRNPLRNLSASDLSIDKQTLIEGKRFKIIEVFVPERKQQAHFLDGDARKMAESILARMRHATG